MADQTVTGYRELPRETVDLINRVKAYEDQLGELYAELAQNPDVDQNAAAQARYRATEAFMWTTRAIGRPNSKL